MYYGLQGLGKSAAESNFDNGRASLWSQFAALRAVADPLVNSKTVTAVQLAGFIAQLQGIIAAHKALYDKSLSMGASKAWLDPRFADYQNPFTTSLNQWQAMLAGMSGQPAAGAPVVVVPTDMTQPTQLVITGAQPQQITTTAPAVSAAPAGGGSAYGDLFGPPAAAAAPAAPGFDLGWLGWVAGGVAAAYLLRKL